MNKCYFFLITSLLIAKICFAQKISASDTIRNRVTSDIAVTLNSYILNHPKEKIHVHFDRDNYEAGDTVWFKVYVVSAYNNQLSALSKLIHIEVVNNEGSLQKLLLPLNAGMANGHLILKPEKYESGIYKFNAFTRLSTANGGNPYRFNLNIGRQGSGKGLVANSPNASNNGSQLRFYPEGGALVAGLRSKVVVKSLDSHGKPISVQGYVVNDKHQKIAVFNTGRTGMGLFALTPQRNVAYQASIENDASERVYRLPKVLDSGYVLALNSIVNDTLTIRLSSFGMVSTKVKLLFQAKGNILNSLDVSLSTTSIIVKVPTAILSPGVNEISLFSMDNNLLANRVLYLPEKQSSPNSLLIGKNEFGKREKVKIALKVVDDLKAGVLGGYSISVFKTDTSQAELPKQPSIFPSLVLTSDTIDAKVIGHSFEDFKNVDNAELDMEMLTQRSGSVFWNEVLAGNPTSTKYDVDHGLSISGIVLNSQGKPMAGAKLNLFSANDMILIDTVANYKGEFVFENFTISDSSDVTIRVKNLGSEKNINILLDEKLSSVILIKADSSVLTTVSKKDSQQSLQEPINELKGKRNTLKTVEIKGKKRPVVKGSVYPFAAAPPDYTIEEEELSKIINLTEYLQNRFIGVLVKNNKVLGRRRGIEGPMLILLNGLNIEDLSSINPSSLSGVQIAKASIGSGNMGSQFGEGFGQGAGFGIIFLTTKRNHTSLKKLPQQTTGIVTAKVIGFQSPKEFYAPIYLSPNENRGKDHRNTLYWKPDIVTKEDGTAEVEFYTSDQTGIYKVVLEGVGLNGKITRQIAYFTVN